jgi:hypothetical protein
MFCDYDNTNYFIKYNKTFDIKIIDNIDNTCKNITNDICKLDTVGNKENINKEIYKIVKNGIYGLNILDPRHVACICLRYCHYYEIEKIPKWYLFKIWRN